MAGRKRSGLAYHRRAYRYSRINKIITNYNWLELYIL